MKIACTVLLLLLLAAPAACAQVREEIETYLVAPYTVNKVVTVTMTDGRKLKGMVLSGDDDKIVVAQKDGSVELATANILNIRLPRPSSSVKVNFAGNLIGGVGLGFAGAAIGKEMAKAIRDDGSPGKIGPLLGGIALGFAGGYLGREVARQAAYQEVILTVSGGVEGQAPKTTGAILLPPSTPAGAVLLLPPPAPAAAARVQPIDPRR